MIFLIAAIVFLVLGWYTFENVALSCIAVIVAIIALCGLFTKSFINAFNNSFDKLLGVYNKAVRFCTNHKVTSFGLVGLFIAILVYLMAITPTALVPTEDTWYHNGCGDSSSRHISGTHAVHHEPG